MKMHALDVDTIKSNTKVQKLYTFWEVYSFDSCAWLKL